MAKKKFLSDPNIIIDPSIGRYGRLQVVYEYNIDGKKYAHCICDCGNEVEKIFHTLGKYTISCGCYHMEKILEVKTDLTGKKFGKLTALRRIRQDGKVYYKCQCDCGSPERLILHNNLVNGNSKSCGCVRTPRTPKKSDLFKEGVRYFKLTSTGIYERRNRDIYVKFKCDCGNEKFISFRSVKIGGTTSCGCYAKEVSRKRLSLLLDEKAMHWKGGRDDNGYCYRFSRKSFKERVRKFFNDKCVICGKTKDENGATKKRLHVHHVFGNKTSLCDENEKRYFVPLCVTCHGLVRARENQGDYTYQTEFVNLIEKRGGCYYSLEEYLEKFRGIILDD